MSAFDKGFSMGMGAFQQALDNKRQSDLDSRAKEEFGWKQNDRARADASRAREDAAWSQIEGWQAMQPPAGARNGVFETPSSGQDTGGSAIASQGLGQSFVRTQQSRPDQLRALEGLAVARRDDQGLERISVARQAAEEDEFIAGALKNYTGADDQIGATAQHLNSTSKSIAMSDPDKDGIVRVSVVTPDRRAQFLDLSRQEQARLYAAAQLMQRNPAKAYEMMSGVNKSLADAIATENGIKGKVVNTNNDAATKLRDGARADAQLQLSKNADGRASAADGRAAAAHKQAMSDRREIPSVREQLAREANPNISEAGARAARLGVTPVPGTTKEKYSYDPVKVQKAFGETTVDPLTQRETVRRNAVEEQQFMKFMGDNPSIRDVDEGLLRYNRAKVQGAAKGQADLEQRRSKASAQMTDANLAATAKKYNMTVEQVVEALAKQGVRR